MSSRSRRIQASTLLAVTSVLALTPVSAHAHGGEGLLVAFVLGMAVLPIIPGLVVGYMAAALLSPKVPRAASKIGLALLLVLAGGWVVRLMAHSPMNVVQGVVFLAGVALVLVPRIRRARQASGGEGGSQLG